MSENLDFATQINQYKSESQIKAEQTAEELAERFSKEGMQVTVNLFKKLRR